MSTVGVKGLTASNVWKCSSLDFLVSKVFWVFCGNFLELVNMLLCSLWVWSQLLVGCPGGLCHQRGDEFGQSVSVVRGLDTVGLKLRWPASTEPVILSARWQHSSDEEAGRHRYWVCSQSSMLHYWQLAQTTAEALIRTSFTEGTEVTSYEVQAVTDVGV